MARYICVEITQTPACAFISGTSRGRYTLAARREEPDRTPEVARWAGLRVEVE